MDGRVAVLGLGEAGSRYAADLLSAGVDVTGYDPVARPDLPRLRLAASAAEAVADATVVLSLNAAAVALDVARDAAPGIATGAVYADLNAASPEDKRTVAAALDTTDALYVDAAVLAPVPRAGLHTPLLLAGPGRARLAAFFRRLGVPVDDAGDEPGAASAAKLLRSVFMKGLAAVLGEALDAAEAGGQRDWLRGQLVAELERADGALVDRLVDGTRRHAGRRLHEMTAATDYLNEIGARADLTRATCARLRALAAEGA